MQPLVAVLNDRLLAEVLLEHDATKQSAGAGTVQVYNLYVTQVNKQGMAYASNHMCAWRCCEIHLHCETVQPEHTPGQCLEQLALLCSNNAEPYHIGQAKICAIDHTTPSQQWCRTFFITPEVCLCSVPAPHNRAQHAVPCLATQPRTLLPCTPPCTTVDPQL